MTHYKMTSFKGRGTRGEIVRLVFAAAGVPLEDHRVERPEFLQIQDIVPFGQLPLFEVEGVRLCQSNAIARLVARRFNLAGKTELEEARVDMIVDCTMDALKPGYEWFFENKKADSQLKDGLKRKFLEDDLPVSLGKLENLLKENGGGDGYFVGKDLTWADLNLLILTNMIRGAGGLEVVEKFAKIHALQKRVESLPRIAEWLAK